MRAGCVVPVMWLVVAASAAAMDDPSEARYAGDRTFDARHYRLDLTFDPEAGEVRGVTSITLSPILEGLSVVELDAGPMQIDRVSLSGVEGNPVEGSTDLIFRHEGEKLRVNLPGAQPAGELLTLDVHYSARPRAGLYFIRPDEGYPDRLVQQCNCGLMFCVEQGACWRGGPS